MSVVCGSEGEREEKDENIGRRWREEQERKGRKTESKNERK